MSYDALLNDTCTVNRPTAATSASGHQVVTFAQSSTGNLCRFNPKTGEEIIMDRDTVIADYTLFCQIGLDIDEADQVVSAATSETFEVKFVKNVAGHGHHQEVDLKLVRA